MIEKDLGFVLKRYNFRETSLIATIYTSRFGKIQGIFKGFYTFKKEFSSPLSIGSLNEFVFYPKKSEIWLIACADLVSDFSFLRENIFKAKAAAILLNLVDKAMLLWDGNSYVFNLMNDCLNYLNQENESKIIAIFLIKFLTLSGFKPEFNHCLSCSKTLETDMLFSVSKGGLVCRGCCRRVGDIQTISPDASQSLLYIQKEYFPLVCRLKSSPKCEAEIFYILSQFLSYHLDYAFIGRVEVFPKHSPAG